MIAMNGAIKDFVTGAVCLTVLCSVSIWNGYPLLFFDSSYYLHQAVDLWETREKAASYSLLLKLTIWSGSLWTLVFFQGAILLYALASTRHAIGLPYRGLSLLICTILCVTLTSLPWLCAYILADIFTATLYLSFVGLVLVKPNRLSKTRLFLLSMIFVLSCMMHNGHPPLILFLLALLWSAQIRPIGNWLKDTFLYIRPEALHRLTLLYALSLALMVLVNAQLSNDVFISRGAKTILVNRLIEDRIVPRLLREHCTSNNYILCGHQNELKDDRGHFLFAADSPIHKLGDIILIEKELGPLIVDSLVYYPWEHARAFARQFWHQLQLVSLANFTIYFPPEHSISRDITQHFKDDVNYYQTSLQFMKSGNYPLLAKFHRLVFWIGISLIPVCFFKTRIKDAKRLLLFTMAIVAIDNALTAFVSHAEERYASRLAWATTFALIVSLELARGHSPASPKLRADPS
jgi:hypothetical protein